MVSGIAAFLGGMALGAGAVDRVTARWTNGANGGSASGAQKRPKAAARGSFDDRRPLHASAAADGGSPSNTSSAARWLAGAELVIGTWGLISAWLIPAMNHVALDMLGPQPTPSWHWTIVFALPFATLLPATLAMGATLPLMVRCFRPLWPDGRCVGALYFANTLGAMVGTLGSTFLLMPVVGLRGSLIALAAINAGIALAVSRLPIISRSAPVSGAAKPERKRAMESSRPESSGASGRPAGEALGIKRWSATAFAGGFLAIGFELIGVRGLTQVMENTAYTYAAILAVFLIRVPPRKARS
jgi:spermidine synthase